ncbi:MAG: hypothetical protein FJ044_03460, partial [Candidatus Cloacimonetes bacterium]|nr:hypothetical protein [Candidatus Cloacimonadota bacterium]
MRKLFPLILIFCLTFNLFGQVSFVLALDKPEKPQKPTPPANPLEETVTPTPTPTPTEVLTPLPKPSKPPKPRTTEVTEAVIENTESPEDLVENTGGSSPANPLNSLNTQNGADSKNTSTSEKTNETTISQKNNLKVENNFQIEVETGGNFANYSVGDAEIITGNANVSLSLVNSGNENIVSSGDTENTPNSQNSGPASGGQNSQNGASSVNNVETKTSETTAIDSKNQAEVKNNFAVASKTGDNNANYTTDGNASVQTGDANTTINVINFANSNGVEVAVKEFNILDDQSGDINLDFSDARKASANTNNGANSTNQSAIDDTGTLIIVNENNANAENKIVVNSDTGGNNVNFTTGGDAQITTGDANIVVNVINFFNNNLTAVGEVVVGVVNIFGNLVGNLILPGNAINLNNGAGSTNSATITQETSGTIIQSNVADITNNIEIAANTGNNNASYNTDGNVDITTGQTNLNVSTTTVANENLVAGNNDSEPIYVVLVNEMGKWVGKIFSVSNESNGAGSENSAEINLAKDTEITQENSATVQNNIVVNANTGDNSTSYTTDGNSTIATGDINVVTNIVNFLNNNFVGRKIVLSIVNVFGSWVGDITTPLRPPSSASGGLRDYGGQAAEDAEESAENAEETTENTEGEGANLPLVTPQNSPTPTPTPGDTSETNDILPSSPSLESEEETSTAAETKAEAETVLDLVAEIGKGEINLNQNLSSQSFAKKVIVQKKQKTLTRPSSPAESADYGGAGPTNTLSPWANRRLLPTISDEVSLQENSHHLPWNLSSAI